MAALALRGKSDVSMRLDTGRGKKTPEHLRLDFERISLNENGIFTVKLFAATNRSVSRTSITGLGVRGGTRIARLLQWRPMSFHSI